MKRNISRDTFRHLTGFGRQMVDVVEQVLCEWKMDEGSPVPTGDLNVYNDIDKREFSFEFRPSVPNAELDRIYVGGVKTERMVSLNILVQQDGRCDITSVPLIMLLPNGADLSLGFQIYQHDFLFDQTRTPIEKACYIGLTKRGWRTRYLEHCRSAAAGSHYRFHQAIRQWHGIASAVSHSVLACALPEQAALAVEEDLIESYTLYPKGLNMIPGGNAGWAYLRKIGAIGATERVAPDDRQAIINRFFERVSRKGLPNPLAAANWLNPNYAEKVICAGEDRLKANQIRDARFLSSLGHDVEAIAQSVGARNVDQIRRLLAGATYSRIV